jgi:hypothetical protein
MIEPLHKIAYAYSSGLSIAPLIHAGTVNQGTEGPPHRREVLDNDMSMPSSYEQQLVLLRPALPYTRNINRRPSEHRTLCLADAATDAELKVNAGLLQS